MFSPQHGRLQREETEDQLHIVFKMASASERRRRRVLENSEERLKKIMGIRSTESPSSSFSSAEKTSPGNDVSELDKAGTIYHKSERERHETNLYECKEMDSENVVESTEVSGSGNTAELAISGRASLHVHGSAMEESKSSTLPQETEQASGNGPSKWIRIVFNILLAVILVGRWTYLNFEDLTNGRGGKDKPEDKLHSDAKIEQSDEVW